MRDSGAVLSTEIAMRKLIVSMNVTLDGYMSGTNCELDWHFDKWDEEMSVIAADQLSKADTILLGRVTYMAMAGHWSSKSIGCTLPRADIDFAEMMNHYQKIVFSSSLQSTLWKNSEITKESPRTVIPKLKQSNGKDLLLYGSGQLVTSLMQLNLVDEYQLWIHPVMLGKGKRLFKSDSEATKMRLYKTQVFTSGVVLLTYQPM